MTLKEFISTIKTSEGCQFWAGAKQGEKFLTKGYGVVRIEGMGKWTVHKLAYTVCYGEIPGNMCVCHKCDNPGCYNPEHLFLGTKHDNSIDARDKGRLFVPDNKKFNEEEVSNIISLHREGKSIRTIAKLVNSGFGTIQRITAKGGYSVRHKTDVI